MHGERNHRKRDAGWAMRHERGRVHTNLARLAGDAQRPKAEEQPQMNTDSRTGREFDPQYDRRFPFLPPRRWERSRSRYQPRGRTYVAPRPAIPSPALQCRESPERERDDENLEQLSRFGVLAQLLTCSPAPLLYCGFPAIGVTGFEPATSSSRRRAQPGMRGRLEGVSVGFSCL